MFNKTFVLIGFLLALFVAPAEAQSLTNCVASSAAPAYVNNTINPCSVDLAGNLRNLATAATGTGGNNPPNSTAITANATGTTASVVATLAAAAAKFTYLCGFLMSSGATAAVDGNATITGTIGGTLTILQDIGTASVASYLSLSFSPCIQSNAVNTAIVVNSAAAGAGGVTTVSAWGFQQ